MPGSDCSVWLIICAWYFIIVSVAFSLLVSSKQLGLGVEKFLENRRQLLVNPRNFRQHWCSREELPGEATARPLPLVPQENPLMSWGAVSMDCGEEISWRKNHLWQPFCQNFGSQAEVFSPRYYRLSLICHLRVIALGAAPVILSAAPLVISAPPVILSEAKDLPFPSLPIVSWELFR